MSSIESLIAFIRKSDFYTAPASTRYHSCHEGGLLEHSLNVYDRFVEKFKDDLWAEKANIDESSKIIIALLHDLCKCYFYGSELKNKKIYSDFGKKSDSNGRFDWETVPVYTVDDKFPMGHGEKSMFLVERFIKLNKTEAMAIRWHMLWTEPKELYNTISRFTYLNERNELVEKEPNNKYALSNYFKIANNFNQENSHHTFSLGKHCAETGKYIQNKRTNDFWLLMAALLHDVGKLDTKTKFNSRGVEDGEYHYYNHNCAGSYSSMFYFNNIETVWNK